MPKLVVGLVVLAILAFGADRIASTIAARSVVQGLQSAQNLSVPPAVTFTEIPFLPQAFRGRYSRIDVGISDVPTSGPLVVDRLDATLYGVRVAAMDAVQGNVTRLPVERGEAEAFVSFPALRAAVRKLLGGRAVDLVISPGGSADRVVFTGKVGTTLGAFTVSGSAQLNVEKGQVRVRLLSDTLTGIPEATRAQVAAQIDLSGLVPGLPYGLRATTVAVDPEGLRLRAVGEGLTIPV